MTVYPFLFYGLIGVYVLVLLAKKARSAAGLAKPLSYAAALTSGAVGATALFVFLTQWFELPGAGLLMIPSTLLSIAFWKVKIWFEYNGFSFLIYYSCGLLKIMLWVTTMVGTTTYLIISRGCILWSLTVSNGGNILLFG